MFRHSIFNKRTNLYQKYPFNSPLTFLFGGIKNNSFLDTNTNQNVTTFDKKIPISSYLVAFVAGELEYGKMSERCGVWTEIGLCQKAYHEFKDAEKYIQIAEEYFNHPYEWGVYNLLVLPFSFPYRGMENPNLTFFTPALIPGDGFMSNIKAMKFLIMDWNKKRKFIKRARK